MGKYLNWIKRKLLKKNIKECGTIGENASDFLKFMHEKLLQ